MTCGIPSFAGAYDYGTSKGRIDSAMLALATYVGHAKVSDTMYQIACP